MDESDAIAMYNDIPLSETFASYRTGEQTMPGYNTQFELTVDDMELIEDALRTTSRSLNSAVLEQDADPLRPCDNTRDVDASMKRINDLLGRLHNQKNFYRPKSGAYIGG